MCLVCPVFPANVLVGLVYPYKPTCLITTTTKTNQPALPYLTLLHLRTVWRINRRRERPSGYGLPHGRPWPSSPGCHGRHFLVETIPPPTHKQATRHARGCSMAYSTGSLPWERNLRGPGGYLAGEYCSRLKCDLSVERTISEICNPEAVFLFRRRYPVLQESCTRRCYLVRPHDMRFLSFSPIPPSWRHAGGFHLRPGKARPTLLADFCFKADSHLLCTVNEPTEIFFCLFCFLIGIPVYQLMHAL